MVNSPTPFLLVAGDFPFGSGRWIKNEIARGALPASTDLMRRHAVLASRMSAHGARRVFEHRGKGRIVVAVWTYWSSLDARQILK